MQKIVIPGEEIATTEEFLSGKNTFEDDGKIIASSMGILEIDSEEMIANVKPMNEPVLLNIGDEVICVVLDVRGSMVTLDVTRVIGNDRQISQDTFASLHISEISRGYVSEASREYRIMDVVKAEVIQATPSLQLSTAKPHLGVLRSLCMKCRNILIKRDNSLFCESCERKEYRKLSKDYLY